MNSREPPKSQLEAYARATYPLVAGIPSFMDYHIFQMERCVEEQWKPLEYTIACILIHHKHHDAKDVYKFLKAYPWTRDSPIVVDMAFFEFSYSWYNLIMEGKIKPNECEDPVTLLRTVNEQQIHTLNTQFRYWEAAGARSWGEHFVDMSPDMWFGPQGQERQRRLSIPGFSDEV